MRAANLSPDAGTREDMASAKQFLADDLHGFPCRAKAGLNGLKGQVHLLEQGLQAWIRLDGSLVAFRVDPMGKLPCQHEGRGKGRVGHCFAPVVLLAHGGGDILRKIPYCQQLKPGIGMADPSDQALPV